VSSMSASSVSLTPIPNGSSQPIANHYTIHDELGLLQDFDVASVGSAASGISTGTLQVTSTIFVFVLTRVKDLIWRFRFCGMCRWVLGGELHNQGHFDTS
jgi:hypothetical protein